MIILYLFQLDIFLAENGDEYGWMGELQIRRYVVKPKFNNSSDSPLSGIYIFIQTVNIFYNKMSGTTIHG